RVGEDDVAVAMDPDAFEADFDDLTIALFAVPQGAFGPLHVIDIGPGADPRGNPATGIAHGLGPRDMPAIDAIVPAIALLHGERNSLLQGLAPDGDAPFAILRVDGCDPAIAARLIDGEAGIVQPPVVEELYFAV